MKTLAELKQALQQETDRIWLDEPIEIKRMRLGVYTSGAGSYGQYFSNMVFVNGDMRAISTWITPDAVLRCVGDPSFTLDQCQKVFEWINLLSVDLIAYLGFVKMGEFVHDIVESYPQMKSKEEFLEILEAWYAYANRLYLWVHQVFPWGLGTAFPKPSEEDLSLIAKESKDDSVQRYFEKYAPVLEKFSEQRPGPITS